MSEPQDPPRIQFPCDYTIRVVGTRSDSYRDTVLSVVSEHAQVVALVGERASRGKKYLSLTITIRATGEVQLRQMHAALIATGQVKMVL